MAMVLFFRVTLCHAFILVAAVLVFQLHQPSYIWQWVVNTQVARLVWAGLGTEWIYKAFAGKFHSRDLLTFIFIKLYELTNLVLTL